MTKAVPHRIGTHLGREVRSVGFDGADDSVGLVANQSLMLINIVDGDLTSAAQTRLTEQIVRLQPLGVFFTGPLAERMFDGLLHALDRPGEVQSVMTNFSSDVLTEAVEQFLISTWPAEDSWERWQDYLLVNVGGSANTLEEAARSLVKRYPG
jgi:hypothetical protein